MQDIKQLLLNAPAQELNPLALEQIKKWDSHPTALQAFDIINFCASNKLASKFAMRLLLLIYDTALELEKITHEQIVTKHENRA